MAKNEIFQGNNLTKIEIFQGNNLPKIEKIQGKKQKGMLLPPLSLLYQPPLADLNWKRLSLFGELNLTGYYNNYYLTKSVYLFWFL